MDCGKGLRQNIYDTGVSTISCLVTQGIVTDFVAWSIDDPRKSGNPFKSDLSTLHATIRHYPRCKNVDVSWFPALLKGIPVTATTETR
jgi:hypothetical protein